MKFSIERGSFIKALQRVQGIVEKRNTMPILSNVLLEAGESSVNVLATDLEVFIKDTVAASVSEKGSITVSARKLFEIAREMPDESIDVSANKEGKVTIKGAKARFNIMGLPAKDFPTFPKVDESALRSVPEAVLKEMIDKTSFAVSTDETRYNINGFLLEKEDSSIRMIATDGHRLALIEKKGSLGEAVEKKSVLLPRKGVTEIRKLLEEGDGGGQFNLGVSSKSAVTKKGETVVSIRLLEGEFPDYRKVIPKGNDREITVGRDELLSSLKRVSILSSDKVKGVKFSFSKHKLTLTSSSPDVGDATEEVDVDYKGEPIEIAFNARYVIDMLGSVEDEKVKILLKDPLSPGIMRPPGEAEYTYVIMPMRL